jgi:glycosyltransferase involved in cell wall biosynthesis
MAKNKSQAGVNVIGHIKSSAGLGNTARLLIDVLRSKGYETAAFDIDKHVQAEISEKVDATLVDDIRELPFDFNLIVVSIPRLPQLWARHISPILSSRFRTAGMLFWELPVVPRAWIPSLEMFDVMLACSHYVKQTIEASIPDVPTIFAEHPIRRYDFRESASERRKRLGIPALNTVFCCTFDPRSGFERKNPLGAIKAWLKAFPDTSDVSLVIKTNGEISKEYAHHPDVGEVLDQAGRDSRIRLLPDRMSHEDVLGLFDCCDVFISLHRSEGLGLIPMEAMSLGKLVVATGYSGNLTFMDERNSFLVPYRLVEPKRDAPFLTRKFAGRTAAWADPDIDVAAQILRYAYANPEARRTLGQQARSDIARRQATAWEGRYIDDMMRLLEQSDRHVLRTGLRRRIFEQELLDPTIRRKNLEAVLGLRKQGW